jgi:hypothetical protein
MRGTFTDDQGNLQVISRRDAADNGYTFFYSGKPCKHGHVAPRYVTTGGCKACLVGMYRPKVNPWTTKLTPFASSKLWTGTDLTRDERVTLRVYLQHCIFEFLRKNRADRGLAYMAELEAGMQEVEERGKFALQDPRSQD